MSIIGSYMARRIKPTVLYNKKDISADINPFIKSLSYTDNMTGEADDIQITLEDKMNLWSNSWMPEKGASLDVKLVSAYWDSIYALEQELRAGTFEIDEISCSFSPSEVSIKGTSVPDGSSTLRGVERTRSWEKVTLVKIAQDIAEGAKMELVYEPEEIPELDRVEQSDESDLFFLSKLCKDNGLALKVFDRKLVVFSEVSYEQAEATLCIVKPGTSYTEEKDMVYVHSILSASFTSKVRDIYKACHVRYQKGKQKELIEYTFIDPAKKDTEGRVLKVNEEVSSVAEAERLAKRKLREKNCEEVSGSISCVGNFKLLASTIVKVLGFGAFDGKYIITRASHSIASGYTVSIDVRRCLDGY